MHNEDYRMSTIQNTNISNATQPLLEIPENVKAPLLHVKKVSKEVQNQLNKNRNGADKITLNGAREAVTRVLGYKNGWQSFRADIQKNGKSTIGKTSNSSTNLNSMGVKSVTSCFLKQFQASNYPKARYENNGFIFVNGIEQFQGELTAVTGQEEEEPFVCAMLTNDYVKGVNNGYLTICATGIYVKNKQVVIEFEQIDLDEFDLEDILSISDFRILEDTLSISEVRHSIEAVMFKGNEPKAAFPELSCVLKNGATSKSLKLLEFTPFNFWKCQQDHYEEVIYDDHPEFEDYAKQLYLEDATELYELCSDIELPCICIFGLDNIPSSIISTWMQSTPPSENLNRVSTSKLMRSRSLEYGDEWMTSY